MDPRLVRLQESILQRQSVLHELTTSLGADVHALQRRAGVARVLTIAFGALSATQAIAAKLWGAENPAVIIFFTLLGVAIATIGGLAAAFRLDERSGRTLALLAECRAVSWDLDSQWQKAFHAADDNARVIACEGVLDAQNAAIKILLKEAAALGMKSIVRDISDRPWLALDKHDAA